MVEESEDILCGENAPVIIEVGSGYIKAGCAGKGRPIAVFPCVVGIPRYQGIMIGVSQKDYYVGEDAVAKRETLTLKYPVERGIVTNSEHFLHILHHALYNKLKVQPEEHSVFITVAPMNPAANREKLLQMLFDTFDVPGIYLLNSAVATLHAYGKTTGLVVESGDGVTHVVPVVDGHALPQAIRRMDFAGRELTDDLIKRLSDEGGYSFTTQAEKEIARNIKETLCYVALDFDDALQRAETSSDLERTYELPDGQVMTIGSQRFRVPEALFRPSLVGREFEGLHAEVCHAIMQSDEGLRQALCANIVLAGGTMLLPGMAERLAAEVKELLPPDLASSVTIACMPDAHYAAWKGGAILSAKPDFNSSWITRAEYDEAGPEIVHVKCPA